MTFTGSAFSAMTEEAFLLGTLYYVNGSVVQGTSPTGVDLAVALNITNPSGIAVTFVFPLTLINTPNLGTPEDNADVVFLPSLIPNQTFVLDGVPHTLRMSFGQSTPGGFTEIDRFSVFEGQSASAELHGVLTASPEPATWGLFLATVTVFVRLEARRRLRIRN